ncbi:MAG: STT3 domain-containing protein [archaeon]
MVAQDNMPKNQEAGEKRQDLLSARKANFLHTVLNNLDKVGIILVLLIALYSFNVRTINIPNLKDVTTGNYTLGPDLDPFLFLRWAKYIEAHGSLMTTDFLRSYPIGLDTSREILLLPYSIVYLYKFLHFFDKNSTVEYAAVIYPVIFFFLAVIAFFLFTRRLFIKETVLKRNLIALVSSLFFIVMPSLVHRTVAGIPEKEAAGLFYLFLSLYFILVSMQSKSMKSAVITGILAGISTGLLGLSWGAVTYIFLSVGLAMLACFLISIIKEKECAAYLSWVVSFTLVLSLLTTKYGGILGLLSSTTSAIVYLVAFSMVVDFTLSKSLYLKIESKIKIPRRFLSFGIAILLGGILILIVNPYTVLHIIGDVQVGLLHPQGTDRISLTVAENSQPYFSSWAATYTPMIFWIFVLSAVMLFYESIRELKRIERYILSSAYFLFLISIIFSRYSSNHIMNGTNTISQFVYFGGFILFIATFGTIYLLARKNKESQKLSNIGLEVVLILSLLLWAAISARGAIRLFFLLDPIVSIFLGFITVHLCYKAFKTKEEVSKVILFVLAIFVIFIVLNAFYSFSQRTAGECAGTIPSAYTIQWQYAMKWVRDNTDKDAVFVHWWDYGYWVQSLGERATIIDGGNTRGYWNHLVGRHILTGQNETEALEVMKVHNISYLLIDPTDIGKYPAYSSIGSDLQYDRYNWVPTMIMDEKQIQETRNGTIYVYQGGTAFEKDFTWYDASTKKQYLFPQQSQDAVIAGVLFKIDNLKIGNNTLQIATQPKAVVIYHGNERIDIPMCYLYYTNQFYDFKEEGPCISSALYIIPKLNPSGQGMNINYIGAGLYLNERAMNALWVKLYLLNQTQNFELAHSEQSYVVKQLRLQGINVPDFVFYGDVNGPINIWKVNYPADIKFKSEYLRTSYPDAKLLTG